MWFLCLFVYFLYVFHSPMANNQSLDLHPTSIRERRNSDVIRLWGWFYRGIRFGNASRCIRWCLFSSIVLRSMVSRNSFISSTGVGGRVRSIARFGPSLFRQRTKKPSILLATFDIHYVYMCITVLVLVRRSLDVRLPLSERSDRSEIWGLRCSGRYDDV